MLPATRATRYTALTVRVEVRGVRPRVGTLATCMREAMSFRDSFAGKVRGSCDNCLLFLSPTVCITAGSVSSNDRSHKMQSCQTLAAAYESINAPRQRAIALG